MNFYCSEKHDKTNRFNSDWGAMQNKVEHNEYFLSQNTANLQNVSNTVRVALAYEATLRWDDFGDTQFGDFIITDEFVCVFLKPTKNFV